MVSFLLLYYLLLLHCAVCTLLTLDIMVLDAGKGLRDGEVQ